MRFATDLPEESPFAVRDALADKDAHTLAREVLAMDVDAYRAASRGSPIKRAKLPAMKRNAAVVLGNIGTESGPHAEPVPVPPDASGRVDHRGHARRRAAGQPLGLVAR